jgi:hypothetical protein
MLPPLEGAAQVRVAHLPRQGLAFTRPADTAGILFGWNENPQPDDPRSGAPEPARTDALVEVHHMAFVAALVTDPMSVARRLGRILGANVTVLGDGLPADCPAATVDLGDCCLALYSLPSPERSAELWGAAQRRPA